MRQRARTRTIRRARWRREVLECVSITVRRHHLHVPDRGGQRQQRHARVAVRGDHQRRVAHIPGRHRARVRRRSHHPIMRLLRSNGDPPSGGLDQLETLSTILVLADTHLGPGRAGALIDILGERVDLAQRIIHRLSHMFPIRKWRRSVAPICHGISPLHRCRYVTARSPPSR